MHWYTEESVSERTEDAGSWQTVHGEDGSYLRVTVTVGAVELMIVEKEDKGEGRVLSFTIGEFQQFLKAAQGMVEPL